MNIKDLEGDEPMGVTRPSCAEIFIKLASTGFAGQFLLRIPQRRQSEITALAAVARFACT
jgi:hypothetical protein